MKQALLGISHLFIPYSAGMSVARGKKRISVGVPIARGKKRIPDWHKHELERLKNSRAYDKTEFGKLDLSKIPEAPVEFNDINARTQGESPSWKYAKKAYIASRKEGNRMILTMRLDGWNALPCPWSTYKGDISVHSVAFYRRVGKAVLVFPVAFARPKCSGKDSSDFTVSYKEAHDVLKKEFPQKELFGVSSFVNEEAWYTSIDVSCNRVGEYMFKISNPSKGTLEFTDPRYHNAAAIWQSYMDDYGQA